MSLTLLLLFLLIAFLIVAFLRQPQFGKLPVGKRMELIEQSPNYKNGRFQNIAPTPFLTNANFLKVIREMSKRRGRQTRPADEIPTVKTDLKSIPLGENVFVWFGHSSYWLQVNGMRLLVDPVLSDYASPVSFIGKAFKGTGIYSAEDIPAVDYLIITHDHYDHLDYTTVLALRSKIHTVVCPLGVGAHLEQWGFDKNRIVEMDWDQSMALANHGTLHTVTSRHFSGRTFKRNQSLWSSYVLQTPKLNIFIGCDGGYGSHFAEIGKRFGPFDLAFLENGQYNKLFELVHAFPEQSIRISHELQAKQIMPMHSGKFSMSSHDWTEPLQRITDLGADESLRILTPKIGEPVYFTDTTQRFSKWWLPQ